MRARASPAASRAWRTRLKTETVATPTTKAASVQPRGPGATRQAVRPTDRRVLVSPGDEQTGRVEARQHQREAHSDEHESRGLGGR